MPHPRPIRRPRLLLALVTAALGVLVSSIFLLSDEPASPVDSANSSDGEVVRSPNTVGVPREARTRKPPGPDEELPDADAAAPLALRGIVCRSDHQPIAGATVVLRTQDKTTLLTLASRPDGSFRATPPTTDGDLVADCSAAGFLPVRERVSASEENRIVLLRPGRVEVRVRFADGAPCPKVSMLFDRLPREGRPTMYRADEQGVLRLDRLRPGEFSLGVMPTWDSLSCPSKLMRIEEGRTTRKTVIARRSYVLTGTVGDRATGVPIENAIVRSMAGPSTTTDRNGAFVLKGLRSKEIIRAKAKRFVAYETPELSISALPRAPGVAVGPESEQSRTGTLRITLTRAAVVRGCVASTDGRPVSGADVRSLEDKTTTDESGRFEVAIPPGQPAVVVARKTGLAPCFSPSFVAEGGQVIADVRLVMSVGAAFHGQVVDENGNPVKVRLTFRCLDHPGASLERLPTDATGRFAAEHLAAGSYRVSLRSRGTIPIDADVTLAEGEVRQGLVFRARSGSSVTGTVKDASGRPVPGALVRVSGGAGKGKLTRFAHTDAAGDFAAPGLDDTVDYRVFVTKHGYREASCPAGPGTRVVVVLQEACLTLKGRVLLDAPEGLGPVPEFRVRVYQADGMHWGVFQDPNGDFEVRNLIAGTCFVEAWQIKPDSKRAFISRQAMHAVLRPGEAPPHVILVLVRARRVAGTVMDDHGVPVPETRVELSLEDPFGVERVIEREYTGSEGRFVFECVGTGAATIRARRDGWHNGTVTVAAGSRSLDEIMIRLVRSRAQRGGR